MSSETSVNVVCIVDEYLSKNAIQYELYEKYSGRGMFGSYAKFAFTTSTHPQSGHGQFFLNTGLAFDNMAKDWIYYLV